MSADSIIAASAHRLNAFLVHEDPEYEPLARVIKLLPLLTRKPTR